MNAVARWQFVIGLRPHRVTAFEDAAHGGVVYLRFQQGKKRTLRSLGFGVRGARGGLDREAVERAQQAAIAQHTALVRGLGVPETPAPVAAPLTIRQGWERAKHPELGKWNKDTAHRRDMDRAITRAISIWGDIPWNAVDRGRIRQLWRRILEQQHKQGRPGVRAAELTVDLVLAVGAWLRDEQLIDLTAALRWRSLPDEFRKDAGKPTPKQPRYTLEEYRRILVTSWEADERYGFILAIGAEYRLGQVVRSYRRHLDRARGVLRVPGEGKKLGGTIHFTAGQAAAVERVLTTGYLAGLEAAYVAGEITDYPLWPGGHFAHGAQGSLTSRAEYAQRAPVNRTALRAWHAEAERLAEIEHVPGRGYYGLRRAAVDAAKSFKISREGLQESGGWADTQMADRVYADQKADYARDEARKVRALMRGEPSPPEPASDPESSLIVTDPTATPSGPTPHEEAKHV